MAGDDPARIKQLPDTTGMRDELVIQACQRFQYDQAFRTAGATLVEAGDKDACTPEQLEAAISERTAAIVFVVSPRLGERGVSAEDTIAIAHRHGLPAIVDAASTLPPTSHLTRWTSMGADLCIFSGGKGIRGPQNTGLVLGRADLVRAAAMNGAPNASVGRPAKVPKEDVVGLVAALELFLAEDHDEEWGRHLAEAERIVAAVRDLPGVHAAIEDDRSVWTAPTVLIEIDEREAGLTPDQVVAALRDGDEPIMTRVFQGKLLVDPHCLLGDEADVVARRLRAALARAAVPVPAS
jgi:D-glucosaminate-6-phosphate ammonia-lyase